MQQTSKEKCQILAAQVNLIAEGIFYKSRGAKVFSLCGTSFAAEKLTNVAAKDEQEEAGNIGGKVLHPLGTSFPGKLIQINHYFKIKIIFMYNILVNLL